MARNAVIHSKVRVRRGLGDLQDLKSTLHKFYEEIHAVSM